MTLFALEEVRESTGIDLEVVHRLPHTPTDAEYKMAKHYLQYVDWKLQTIMEEGL